VGEMGSLSCSRSQEKRSEEKRLRRSNGVVGGASPAGKGMGRQGQIWVSALGRYPKIPINVFFECF